MAFTPEILVIDNSSGDEGSQQVLESVAELQSFNEPQAEGYIGLTGTMPLESVSQEAEKVEEDEDKYDEEIYSSVEIQEDLRRLEERLNNYTP